MPKESRCPSHWTTAAPRWVAQYAAHAYHFIDPRVTRTLGRSVPVAWDDAATVDPRMHAFLADARKYAIRSGVAMACATRKAAASSCAGT